MRIQQFIDSVRLCNKPHKIGRPPWRLSNPPAVCWQFLLGWGIRRCCQPCSLNCPEILYLTQSSQLSFLAISHQDTWQCPYSLNCNFSLFQVPPSSPVSNKRPPFTMVSEDSSLSYVNDMTAFFFLSSAGKVTVEPNYHIGFNAQQNCGSLFQPGTSVCFHQSFLTSPAVVAGGAVVWTLYAFIYFFFLLIPASCQRTLTTYVTSIISSCHSVSFFPEVLVMLSFIISVPAVLAQF